MPQQALIHLEKAALFIDMSNLFYAAKKMNIRIDYRRLRDYLSEGKILLRAFAYAGIDPQNPEPPAHLTWMKRNGYKVVTKPVRRYEDGTVKANLDIELAIDMLTIAEHVDCIILVSGDGDFVRLVEAVQFKGVRVEVVGLAEMTSTALIEAADRFIDLAEIVQDIQMVQRYEPGRRHAGERWHSGGMPGGNHGGAEEGRHRPPLRTLPGERLSAAGRGHTPASGEQATPPARALHEESFSQDDGTARQ
jgi:uncharacterized LabA/DUF88 family protein